MLKEGEDVCEKIRKEARNTITHLQLHKQKLLSITYEQMNEQQRGLVSIKSEMVLQNYSVRIRTDKEDRRLKQVMRMRKMEIKEQLTRLEGSIAEVLNEKDFSSYVEQYFMNRNTGTPEYSEDLSQLRALEEFAERERQKKLRREQKAKDQMGNQN